MMKAFTTRKTLSILIIALSIFSFSSCTKETSFIKKVNNYSDYPFSVEYVDAESGLLIRKMIEAHSSTTIYYSIDKPENEASCLNTLGAPKVIMETGLSLTIDIDLERNWETTVDEKNNGNAIRHTCIFQVDNGDFVE